MDLHGSSDTQSGSPLAVQVLPGGWKADNLRLHRGPPASALPQGPRVILGQISLGGTAVSCCTESEIKSELLNIPAEVLHSRKPFNPGQLPYVIQSIVCDTDQHLLDVISQFLCGFSQGFPIHFRDGVIPRVRISQRQAVENDLRYLGVTALHTNTSSELRHHWHNLAYGTLKREAGRIPSAHASGEGGFPERLRAEREALWEPDKLEEAIHLVS